MIDVYLIGIGGSGLSAIARFLLESGYSVAGSDRNDSPLLESLRQAGATVYLGHASTNVAGARLVVRSSAVPDDHIEVQAALAARIPVYKRADFLGRLMTDKLGIAVAGTHGKTTTTSMIAWMLTYLQQDPSYIIGGISANLGTNAHAGQGETFVIEADEYDRMFLGLQPKIALVTNVEHDHPDCFPTPEDFSAAFAAFVGRLPAGGVLLVCLEDAGAAGLLTAARDDVEKFSYGFSASEADYTAQNLSVNGRGGFDFGANKAGEPMQIVSLGVPGKHNVLNALAALAVADRLGLNLDGAAAALGEFRGSGRRFEVRGEAQGVLVIDDYAHHPTEIQATLAAARDRFADRRIWAVWQPHTYSRLEMLFERFAEAFGAADQVIVTDVYAAREPRRDTQLAQAITQAMQHPCAVFTPTLQQAFERLAGQTKPGDVVLVLSAGDADQISGWLLDHLRAQGREG